MLNKLQEVTLKRYIIIKLLKINDKEVMLRLERRKLHIFILKR